VAPIAGVTLPFPGPVFNETVVRLDGSAAAFRTFARSRGVLAGIPLEGVAGCGAGDLLVAVTEKRTWDEIETLAGLLEEYLAGGGRGAGS